MTWDIVTSLRRAVLLLPVLGLSLLATSCDGFFVSDSSVQSVTVTPSAVLLEAGATPPDTITLISSARTVGGASNTDTSSATWTSSPTGVVSVASGVVTVLTTETSGNVSATVTATDGGQSGTCAVLTYTGVAPTSISVNIPAGLVPASIAPGQSFQLTATAALNGNANFDVTKNVSWGSSSSVATVNASGFVTVSSTATAGTTFTITATANFGASAPTHTVTGTSTTFTIS